MGQCIKDEILVAIRITDPDTDTDPYRDTGKTCLGGGMHCHSASSFFYSARNARIASAELATAIPSVRLSVRLSHAGIVSKRRHVARCSLHRWIAKCV